MARRKDILLETVSMFDQNTQYTFHLTPDDRFYAKWHNKIICSGTVAHNVHTDAKRLIQESCTVVWYPAIMVLRTTSEGCQSLRVSRLLVGRHFQGHWVKCEWGTEEDWRDTSHPIGAAKGSEGFPLVIERKQSFSTVSHGVVIEYDETKCENLVQVAKLLDQLWQRIDDMVADPLLTQLLAIGGGMGIESLNTLLLEPKSNI